MKGVKIMLPIICVFQMNYAFARHQPDGQELLYRFDRRFSELDSLICPVPEKRSDIRGGRLSAAPRFTPVPDDGLSGTLGKRVETEIKTFKSRTGLQITGQTYYRLDHGLGLDENDALACYDAKVQAELRWSVFQSSLFKRKGKINEIRVKGEIDRMTYEKDRLGMSVARLKEFFKQRQDSLLCGILRHRIKNLSLLAAANDYLLSNESISSDELLNILNEKAEAERKLMGAGCRYPQSQDLSTPDISIVKIDTLRLLSHVRAKQIELRALDLRISLLAQQEANAGYWSKVDMVPFVRYSYYTRAALPNTSNVDAGISFKLPVSVEARRERQKIRAERELLAKEKGLVLTQVYDEVRFILNDVERLNNSIAGEYRRSKELKEYLTRRGKAYLNRIGEYSRLARMKEYNSYLLCLEKMIEFGYRRDCLISDLSRYLTDEHVENFCHGERLVN